MKLGMNMLLWSTDVTGPEYLPVFEMLRDAGYDGIEVPIFGGADADALGRLGEQLDGLGLIPLGSDAWLAKNEWPREGSIVLVHANGNEPLGVRRLMSR